MRDVSRTSVLSRLKALRYALQPKATISSTLGRACASQRAFASLDAPSLGVTSLSLNTLKTSANVYIEDGGWNKLDALRKQLHRVWEATKTSDKKKKGRRGISDLHAEIKRLQEELDASDRARLRLARAYLDLLRIAKSLSTRDSQVIDELTSHLACWTRELGLPLAARQP